MIFICGTDTNVGKTIISSWIALHTKFAYFKPIQTGIKYDNDSKTVKKLSNTKIYNANYSFEEPLSPHIACKNTIIDINCISLPTQNHLIVEGAGGVLVPLNKHHLMIDLIKILNLPVIVVTRTTIGTINHTLLTIESLKARNIEVLGIVMNGIKNLDNKKAIEFYGNISVLAEFPHIENINSCILHNIKLPIKLKKCLL